MLSIIICSKNTDISSALKENIKKTIGVEYEIIVIDNSGNEYSIFSAYNKGVEKSNFPYLCFVHEDVLFKTQDWGKNLLSHLTGNNIGFVGIAGSGLVTRIPASWWMVGYGYKNIIQHNKKSNKKQKFEVHQNSFSPKSVVVLDGVFLSSHRDVFDKIKFDENFEGFHGYDHDICIQSKVAGFNNLVVSDILLEHFSEGEMNAQYYLNLIAIYKKWNDFLPLYSSEVSVDTKNNLNKIEEKLFGKLIRRLSRIGLNSNQIIEIVKYFVNTSNAREIPKYLRFLSAKILFERVFNSSK